MVCQVDSREKARAIKLILAEFDRAGVKWFVSKLFVGDYMSMDNPRLVIDRKQNLLELCNNVVQDHKRFAAELTRAKECGIHVIILCEHGPDVKTFADVKNWKPKYGKVTGKALADAIFRLEIGYGVPVYYCAKQSTGKRIVEILSGGNDA